MKVLLINGSPKANGNTARALEEMVTIFSQEGIEAERLRDLPGTMKVVHCRVRILNPNCLSPGSLP